MPRRSMALALLTRMSTPPKERRRLRHGGLDLLVEANVARNGERLSARRLDLRGGGVDRAGNFRVFGDALGGDDDIGAVARGAQRDGEADAAARAGDEEGFSGEGTGHRAPCLVETAIEIRGDISAARRRRTRVAPRLWIQPRVRRIAGVGDHLGERLPGPWARATPRPCRWRDRPSTSAPRLDRLHRLA